LEVDYIPKILTLPLAEVKNGGKQFWKENFHAANGKAQDALMNSPVSLFFEGARGEGYFCNYAFK
jgi:hypothetical protein